MKITGLSTAILASAVSMSAGALDLDLTYTKVWTYAHGVTTTGQVAEIPAFDSKTNTLWVAGIVGVDVLDAATGALVGHIDVTPYGAVNSVAIRDGLAALAVEATNGDRRNPGSVLFYNTRTRSLTGGINQVTVGSLPDMLTFTPDGKKLLVANEGTPNVAADAAYSSPDPAGSVSIIDVARRTVIATAGLAGVPMFGDNIRLPASTGMDFEPEYIAVGDYGLRAYVTLQEGNAIGVLDLTRNAFTRIIGLGAKDFSQPGNEIDSIRNDGFIEFISVAAKGLYMPDTIASYTFLGLPFLVMANEGDFREDNFDRAVGSDFGAVAPLNGLRVSKSDSSPGNLYAAGARSFSIRGPNGTLVYDSGSILDRQAKIAGIYDDDRSRDKGVEPEGVALLELGWRTYAFIGLERTTKSAVAVFDVTNPWNVRFLDMIVTDGDRAPEGLAAYYHRGNYYLAIANETKAPGAVPGMDTSNTTLYRLGWALSR
jgi:DNA-binding beta-propeller fold protein YncE